MAFGRVAKVPLIFQIPGALFNLNILNTTPKRH